MFVEGVHAQSLAATHGQAATEISAKGFSPRSRQNSSVFTREDNLVMARSIHHGRRPPQRSRTTHEHIPQGPQILTFSMASPQHRHPTSMTPGLASAQILENAASVAETKQQAQPMSVAMEQQQQQHHYHHHHCQQQETSDSVTPLPNERQSEPRRPKLGAPRRSYSVMDYEPVPPEQRPASGPLTLETLPSELHFAVFDFLDPIDATCLGLTNKHFYAIHRRMHGSVPLSVRRDGPNELEWAWHRAAYPTPPKTSCPNAATTGPLGLESGRASHLAALRVRGKGLCRKCGVSRCELHKHIVGWMRADYEYCSVRDKFVPRPGEEARAHCYMSNPTNTTRCGRHRMRKNKSLAT